MVLGLGVAVITTGATLLALDGRCSNTRKKPTDTTTKSECGQIYDIPPALGGAFTAIGGGLFVVSGVLLTVDEVRVAGKRGHQVMAGVTLRF
ncbi:hypothetical protein G6O69_33935 [Pseudenhygromyxa sp. WMMC2535]|uniref:hypothetical protein n=1 Tax=Pseudenhygromyxa sp. WMMC2535 TaxID=2712867 RepID=UPI001595F05B|nr:hypothetical protein [Pseudenhygromyxa sp. WMMC2535]NVB42871.1 hypothetical protein [Pseudenhygromyxa sp. WMMC2535]